MQKTKTILLLAAFSAGILCISGCAGTKPPAEREDRFQSVVDSLTREHALEYYMNGALNEEAEDYYRAAFDYRIAQMYDPSSAEIALSLGKLYAKLGESRAALITLENGFTRHPENEELSDALSQIYFQAGLLFRAERMFRKILSIRELNELELRQYIALLNQFERFDDALDVLYEYQSRFGNNAWVLDKLVRINLRLKREKEAQKAIEALAALDPTSDMSFFLLGGFAAVQRNWSEAETNYRKALEIDSSNIRYWVNLCQALTSQKKFSDLLDVSERAVANFPDQFEFYDIKADALEKLGRVDEAITALRQSIEVDSTQIDSWLRLSGIFHRLEAWDLGTQAYEAALTLDPDNPLILNNYAYMLSVQNSRLDYALDMVSKALEQEPKNTSYIDTRGWIYYRLGRYKEALADIKSVLKKDKSSAEVYEHLGYIYEALGKQDKAVKAWRKSLELNPDNEELRRQIP